MRVHMWKNEQKSVQFVQRDVIFCDSKNQASFKLNAYAMFLVK